MTGLISGHERNPHCAYVPLPVTGSAHADGRIMGIAVVLPNDGTPEERRKVLIACDAIREIHLKEILGHWTVELANAALNRGQAPEHLAGPAAIGVSRRVQQRVRMSVQRVLKLSGSIEVIDRDLAVPARLFELGVGPVQRVLQHRKLARVIARVVQKQIHEARIDFSSRRTRGLLDGLPPLVARHVGHKVLALVQGFGEVVEVGALTQKVRNASL